MIKTIQPGGLSLILLRFCPPLAPLSGVVILAKYKQALRSAFHQDLLLNAGSKFTRNQECSLLVKA
jgi:hypothetical protein